MGLKKEQLAKVIYRVPGTCWESNVGIVHLYE